MNIKKIRNDICSMRGLKVTIIYNGSRNKRERYSGIIYKVFMNVFSLLLANGEIKSFSYNDVLTKTVIIVK